MNTQSFVLALMNEEMSKIVRKRKRDEAKVEAWKTDIKPKLEATFQDPDIVVLCEDQMVLSSTTTFQKIWLKKGEYPKIEVSNTKKNKSLYGFLNIKTGVEHSFIKDWQTFPYKLLKYGACS